MESTLAQLKSMSLQEVAYRCGFPIRSQHLDPEIFLDDLIDKLSRHGLDEYCRLYQEENKEYMKRLIDADTNWTIFHSYNYFINEVPMLDEAKNVFDYSSFDLFILPDGPGRYFFVTTNEISDLRFGDVHPQTGQPIPDWLIEEYYVRSRIRQDFDLPSCQTIRQLLNV